MSSVVAGPVFEDGTSAAAVAHFHRAGWVHVRPADGDGLARDLRAWADEVPAWGDAPEGPGGRLQYREMTDRGPALCRSENLVPHHTGLRALLCAGKLVATAGALLGEPAVLYKDKLNHKLPGGAGYAPTRTPPPTASSMSTCPAWWRSTTPPRRTGAWRWCPVRTTGCGPPTRPGASGRTSWPG